jgi:hypothetical protein
VLLAGDYYPKIVYIVYVCDSFVPDFDPASYLLPELFAGHQRTKHVIHATLNYLI